MRYRVTINNDAYTCKRFNEKNWEVGTRNDYMLTINGRTFVENSLKEVRWFLDMFQGNTHLTSEWTPENSDKKGKYGDYYGMSDRYYKWLHKRAHTVKYHDNFCNLDRQQFLSGYGFCLGYFNKEKYIATLRSEGVVQIPFKVLYDLRQYDKCMNGCFVEIKAVA